jgi:hypothetical protein
MHIQPFIINNFQPSPVATSEVRKGPDQENVHNSGDTLPTVPAHGQGALTLK